MFTVGNQIKIERGVDSMENKVFGYARVSTSHQSTDRQLDALIEYGVAERDIITDYQSGKDFNRQGYISLKENMLRKGDTLVVKELDRLGRDKKMIKEELLYFKANGIRVKILNIPTTLMDIDGNDWILDMVSNILIEVLSTIAEEERVKNHVRQREVDHANKYTVGAAMKSDNIVCDNPAVSDVKLWLCEKNVFSYLFKNGKTAVLQAIELIERCKQEEDILEDGTSIQSLEEERDKLKKRLKNLQTMVMDELIDTNDFKEHKAEIDEQVSLIDRAIAQYEIDKAKREKKVFDLESIKERLNTFIDLKGYKVNEEMIDMFVERIIYRGIVNGNDEFLWVMNLSGEVTDTSAKYKIKGYDKAYSDSLMDDKNFNIVARMMIPMEECKRYCEKEADRKFRAKFWRPITIKIAIQ